MNAWAPVFSRSRRSLIALAVVVLLSAALVYGLGLLADNQRQTLTALQGSLQAEQAALEVRQNDLVNVRTHIKSYERLIEQGLVGTPDRAQWVEQLQASHQRLGLPGRVSLQLQAAKPLAANDAEPPSDPNAPPIVPQTHDLQFDIRDVHEEELLALLQDYRDSVKARFRVDACHLRDPTDTGLSVSCTLRFVTIPATISPAASAAPAGAH